MKTINAIIVSTLLTLNIRGGEIKGDIGRGEWDKSFHAELHNEDVECYLITIYDAKAGKNNIKKPQMDIKATIVGVIKGKREIGDKIEFDRVCDKGFREGSKYEGEMYYVFYHRAPMNGSPNQGQLYIDSQDAVSLFKFAEKRAEISTHHPHK